MKSIFYTQSLVFLLIAITAIGSNGSDATPPNPLVRQLETAVSKAPNDPALRYYLGVLNLRDGNRAAAIAQFEAYLAMAAGDPTNSKYVSIREQLTVLKSRQAREAARSALAAGDTASAADANTLAVLELNHSGTREEQAIAKGMTAMIITDLAKVPQLKVVERARMQALINEMNLAAIGIVDPATSARVGRLLEAQSINAGRVTTTASDVRIDVTVSDTFTRSMIGENTNEGPKQAFFELEKKIVFDILRIVGINKEDLDDDVLEDIEHIQTRNYDAFVLYGAGLALLDNNQLAEAKTSFSRAAALDPSFKIARDAELETPVDEVDPSDFALDNTLGTGTTTTASSSASGSTATTATSLTSSRDATAATIDKTTDATTQIAQDTTAVRSDPHSTGLTGGGPTAQLGYFTNMLRNAAGDYHGIYFNTHTLDLSGNAPDGAGEALFDGIFYPNALTGSLQQIETLVVVDNMDPITIGLPNAITVNNLPSASSYLAWGTWSDTDEMVRQSNPTSPNGHYLFDTTGYVVYGDATTEAQMLDLVQSDASFTYDGSARGTHIAEPNVDMTGTFSAQVDILGGMAEIPSFELNINSANHSVSISNGSGFLIDGAAFFVESTDWSIDGITPTTTEMFNAQITGALYGPNGEAMGGIFLLEKDGGANSVVGAFQGVR